MRGVCALNMEAMHMFKENGNDENQDPRIAEPVPQQMDGEMFFDIVSSLSLHSVKIYIKV